MGCGILAKNPEAEYVDDLSIWTQKKKKRIPLCLLLMTTAETSKAVFIFLAVFFFSLEFFFEKGILLRKSYSFLQAKSSEALSTIKF